MSSLIPPDLPLKIVAAMKRPEGTVVFNYSAPELFDRQRSGGMLLQVPAGLHLFRLERDDQLNLIFTHASPGTGTRAAEIDITPLEGNDTLFIALTWSTEKIGFSVGVSGGGDLLSADGEPKKTNYIVVNSEPNPAAATITSFGDEGLESVGFRGYTGNELTEEPAAILVWGESEHAIQTLRTGTSREGYGYESVQANAVISMLVTGLEAYCQRRFVELVGEGIHANFHSLAASSRLQRAIRAVGGMDSVIDESSESPFFRIRDLSSAISFQDYEQCKAAYRDGYGISFSKDLEISSDELGAIRAAIKHRHQIAHVSPLMHVIARSIGTDKLEFAPQFATEVEPMFRRFIDELHKATLRVRPPDSDASDERAATE